MFEIEAAGGPIKQVKWYKNGQEINNLQTEQLVDDGVHYKLIIPNISIDNNDANIKVYLFFCTLKKIKVFFILF